MESERSTRWTDLPHEMVEEIVRRHPHPVWAMVCKATRDALLARGPILFRLLASRVRSDIPTPRPRVRSDVARRLPTRHVFQYNHMVWPKELRPSARRPAEADALAAEDALREFAAMPALRPLLWERALGELRRLGFRRLRTAAARALARCGGTHEAVQELLAILPHRVRKGHDKDRTPWVKTACAEALGLADARRWDPLLALLEDHDFSLLAVCGDCSSRNVAVLCFARKRMYKCLGKALALGGEDVAVGVLRTRAFTLPGMIGSGDVAHRREWCHYCFCSAVRKLTICRGGSEDVALRLCARWNEGCATVLHDSFLRVATATARATAETLRGGFDSARDALLAAADAVDTFRATDYDPEFVWPPCLGVDNTSLLSMVAATVIRFEREAETAREGASRWKELMTAAMDLLLRRLDCVCYLDDAAQDDGRFHDEASSFVRTMGVALGRDALSGRPYGKRHAAPRAGARAVAGEVLEEVFRRAKPPEGRGVALLALAASEFTEEGYQSALVPWVERVDADAFARALIPFPMPTFWVRWLSQRLRPMDGPSEHGAAFRLPGAMSQKKMGKLLACFPCAFARSDGGG